MSKPSVNWVKEWTVEDETDTFTIYSGTAVFDGDYYKVITSDGKEKLFYGETAWSDASRHAHDYELTVLYK